jgi:hypothetical protein
MPRFQLGRLVRDLPNIAGVRRLEGLDDLALFQQPNAIHGALINAARGSSAARSCCWSKPSAANKAAALGAEEHE